MACESFKRVNSGETVLIVLDGNAAERTFLSSQAVFDHVVNAEELFRSSNYSWKFLAFKYDVIELATAIKPRCFEFVFSRFPEISEVAYFDPDIQFFRRIETQDIAENNRIGMVTPHFLDAEENGGVLPQNYSLISGVFNLGFLVLRRTPLTFAFLNWWSGHLLAHGFLDRAEGLFYDQNWITLALIVFPDAFEVSRDPGMNVAWWNLHERSILLSEGNEYQVLSKVKETTDLVFFHFSGYSVGGYPILNGRYQNFLDKRLSLSESVYSLYRDYEARLRQLWVYSEQSEPYRFNYYENGVEIEAIHRRWFRQLTEGVETCFLVDTVTSSMLRDIGSSIKVDFGNPFSVEKDSFYRFLRSNRAIGSARGGVVSGKASFRNRKLEKTYKRYFPFVAAVILRLLGVKRYQSLLNGLRYLTKPEFHVVSLRGRCFRQ